jgi:hypothetical protein
MTTPDESAGKIERHSKGIGEISSAMIEKRAREIALQEGRSASAITDADRDRARRELEGGGQSADDAALATGSTFNPEEPPGTPGHMTKKLGPDAEQDVVRKLVEEGVDEAAHEQMTAAEKEARRREKL